MKKAAIYVRVSTPVNHYLGNRGEKNDIVLLAPHHQFIAHELTLSARETVLATEFQPSIHGSFDRDVLPDGFTLQQGFEVSFKPLRVPLSLRPDAGLGRPLVLPTFKLLSI